MRTDVPITEQLIKYYEIRVYEKFIFELEH